MTLPAVKPKQTLGYLGSPSLRKQRGASDISPGRSIPIRVRQTRSEPAALTTPEFSSKSKPNPPMRGRGVPRGSPRGSNRGALNRPRGAPGNRRGNPRRGRGRVRMPASPVPRKAVDDKQTNKAKTELQAPLRKEVKKSPTHTVVVPTNKMKPQKQPPSPNGNKISKTLTENPTRKNTPIYSTQTYPGKSKPKKTPPAEQKAKKTSTDVPQITNPNARKLKRVAVQCPKPGATAPGEGMVDSRFSKRYRPLSVFFSGATENNETDFESNMIHPGILQQNFPFYNLSKQPGASPVKYRVPTLVPPPTRGNSSDHVVIDDVQTETMQTHVATAPAESPAKLEQVIINPIGRPNTTTTKRGSSFIMRESPQSNLYDHVVVD